MVQQNSVQFQIIFFKERGLGLNVKKFIAIGVTIATVMISIMVIDSFTDANFQSSESNMQRKYGTVDTTMGSPVLGSPLAPITIIEFGDYQCPQCY